MSIAEKATPVLAGGQRELCFETLKHTEGFGQLPISLATRKRYEGLLHQQFWCLGADVRCGTPNLLERYGFQKRRPPKDSGGQSMYRLGLDLQRELSLWGFGCVLRHTEQGKLFLSRYSLMPLYCSCPKPMSDVWLPSELRSTFRPDDHYGECCMSMLLEVVRWFGQYERWVVETIGVEQRRELLEPWKAKIVCQADEMAAWWGGLERTLESAQDRGVRGP